MKGVILSICPAAQIVDITHEIPSIQRSRGGLRYSAGSRRTFLRGPFISSWWTPAWAPHAASLLAESRDQYFVAPDNGVLSFIRGRDPSAVIRELSNADLWLKRVSATFHGRDIFAPVAAAIALGKAKPKDAGARMEAPMLLESTQPHETHPAGTWHGTVLSTDRFRQHHHELPAGVVRRAS